MTSPLRFGSTPARGHQRTDRRSQLRVDSLQLDTVFLCREAGYFPDDAAKRGD